MSAATIAAELRGEDPLALIRGEPLTAAERDVLVALGTLEDTSLPNLATALCLHINSLKYRLTRIRAKYGLPNYSRNNPNLLVLYVAAVRRGDVVPPAEETAIRGFLSHVVSRLPNGPMQPMSTGLRTWLEGELARYLRERQATSA